MAINLNSIFTILIPIITLIAIYLEPLKQITLQKGLEYAPHALFYQLRGQPTVLDTRRNITYMGSYISPELDIEHFQNIFYAEEPSGKRRFAPPVPINHPEGSVVDATRSGAWCPQGTGDVLPFTSRVTNVSENCLSLRIARPRNVRSDTKLPVVVWIHGGRLGVLSPWTSFSN